MNARHDRAIEWHLDPVHTSHAILDSIDLSIICTDPHGLIVTFNRGAERLLGYRLDEVLSKDMVSLIHDPGEIEAALAKRGECTETGGTAGFRMLAEQALMAVDVDTEWTYLAKGGNAITVSVSLSPVVTEQGLIGFCSIARKVVKRRLIAGWHLRSQYDSLTELPNRALIKDRAIQALARAHRNRTRVAIAFVGLDGTSSVNVSLGRSIGDEVIKQAAVVLKSALRATDSIGRDGGDEFVVVLSDLPDVDAASSLVAKIVAELGGVYDVNGHEISISASVGVAVFPDHGEEFEFLLKKAYAAMHAAKEDGRNTYRVFDQDISLQAGKEQQTWNELGRAVSRGEFELHYQPQLDLEGGTLVGAEALLRWRHPELGLLSPAKFIPIAEKNGLIVPIGEWVLREAARQAKCWQEQGAQSFMMAVNLSAIQFRRGDIVETVARALGESGLDPQFLELEITESLLMNDTDSTLTTLRRLKKLGVKLAIDDFGTGYSSLSYLSRFQVDKLKIDQSFIRNIHQEPSGGAIVRAIVQLAKALGLRTVAEGIETDFELGMLRDLGCEEGQGYLFSRPVDAGEFAKQIASMLDQGAVALS